MSLVRALRAAYYLFETALLAPGIVSHEAAHLLACRLTGTALVRRPNLDPFGAEVTLVHERVDSFRADVTIAVAPLVVNTVLGVVAFALGSLAPWPAAAVPYWLGGCFALTAFPSVGDTETLYDTAASLPRPLRPAAYLVAVPLRTFTQVPGSAGFAGFVWVFVLYGVGRVAPAGV